MSWSFCRVVRLTEAREEAAAYVIHQALEDSVLRATRTYLKFLQKMAANDEKSSPFQQAGIRGIS